MISVLCWTAAMVMLVAYVSFRVEMRLAGVPEYVIRIDWSYFVLMMAFIILGVLCNDGFVLPQ